MKWKTICGLSALGIAIGIALVLGFIHGVERPLWFCILIACSLWIGTQIDKKHFLHGFVVGLIGGSVTWLIVFLFFPMYIARNPDVAAVINKYPGALDEARYTVLLYMIFTGLVSGVTVGFLSWLTANLRLGFISIRSRIKGAKAAPPIRSVFYIFASLLSFFASIYCFFIFFASCAGHPPYTQIGIWVLPVSGLATWIFFRLGRLFWKLSYGSKLVDSSKTKDQEK